MTQIKLLRANESADILTRTVQAIGVPPADSYSQAPEAAVTATEQQQQASPLPVQVPPVASLEQEDPFLASLPDMAPPELQLQQVRAPLLVAPRLPPVEEQSVTVVTGPRKRKRAATTASPRTRKRPARTSADDQPRLPPPRLVQTVISTAAQPQGHSLSLAKMQITDSLVARAGLQQQVSVVERAAAAAAADSSATASSATNRLTTHVNNVATLTAQVFDELMAPAVEAKEMRMAKVKSGVLKRVLVKMVTNELLNAPASSVVVSNGGDDGRVLLTHFVDVMLSCAVRLDVPVFDMSV